MNAALLMVRSLLSLPDRLDLHVTATYSGHRSRAHQKWRTVRALGRPYVVSVSSTDWVGSWTRFRLSTEARLWQMARRYGSQGSGPSAPGAGRPVPGAPPGPARRFRYRRRCHRLLGAGTAVRDAVNAGPRLWLVAVGWPQIPTRNATDTPDMETSRLRYDDGASGPHSSIAGKSQCGRWVAGLAAAGLDTRLHMRQECNV